MEAHDRAQIDPYRLRQAMKSKHFSISELARESRVSAKTIARWLNKEHFARPQREKLLRVASALAVDIADLLQRDSLDADRWLAPANQQVASREPSTVHSIADLLGGHATTESVVEWMAKSIDRVVWPKLDRREHGNISAYTAKWQRLPEFGRFLVHPSEWIVGYWSAVPIDTETEVGQKLYASIYEGTFRDGDLKPGHAASVDMGGTFDLYISGVAILEPYRYQRRALLESFVDFLQQKAMEDVYFSRMIARAWTDFGHDWCRGFEMDPVTNCGSRGVVYERRSLFPFPNSVIFTRRSDLNQRYSHHWQARKSRSSGSPF